MSENTNKFSQTVMHYNAKRLSAIINAPHKHDSELVEACRAESAQRSSGQFIEVDTPDDSNGDYLTVVKVKLSQGITIENCEAYLLHKGLSQEEALVILDKAARTAPLKEKKEKPKENSTWTVISTFIFIFFVLRMLYRIFGN